MKEKILKIVIAAVEEINHTLSQKLDLSLGEDTPLYGKSGSLDSLALVSLIVNIETRLEQTFEQTFILADEKSMSQRNSPFATIKTIVNYIVESLQKEEAHHAI